ncbi:hypothetical protein GTA08_BOTSDO11636 [Neofusicoccum parvum]|uniref:Uncharacterized protein n=1 Tax=Neofusicoccum parvum TaxID=310453 RepID=A0ACB5RPV9_9PEZI|nr:hypothetical protein GTA08_BOTSDO11636 [Neofusicoccum parvum]
MASSDHPPARPAAAIKFIRAHDRFIAVTLHRSSSSASVPGDFLTWLEQCCVSLCHEIHAALPYLRLFQYPSILAPAGAPDANPQTLRYLIGVARQQISDCQLQHDDEDRQLDADEDDATLSTRLTCGLQAFLKQLRLHPVFLKTAGLWLNARYVTQADLGAPESFVDHSPNPSASASSSDKQQQQQQQALPATALSAIGAALRIAPEPTSPPAIVPHSSLQPTAQPSAPPSAAKAKLRPVSDVLDRLRWDESLGGTAAYAVGYRDRFDGVLELSLERWVAESTAEDWIPLHRVSYVKRRRDGALVWWREGRVDLVFGSGNGTGSEAGC